jgi:Ca2+-binding RTX toxin-like protein
MVSPRHLIAGAVACGALLGCATPALAATVSSDGATLSVAGGAEPNNIIVSTGLDGASVEVSDAAGLQAGAGCELDDAFGKVRCSLPTGSVAVDTGAGDDRLAVLGLAAAGGILEGKVRAGLGDGNDTFKGSEFGETVSGGAGADTLEGEGGADALDGGAGDDILSGALGADTLLGGDGNDTFDPDGYAGAGEWAADIVDGGPGVDTADLYGAGGAEADRPKFSLTLDGVANDGRAGEGDNVTAVEKLKLGAAGTFVGDDAANEVTAPEVGSGGSYDGRGGDDAITAGDAHGDVVTGGAGNDTLTAGFGNDTITGGPGKDIVNADRPGRCNELHCDLPGGALGDDTIDVRDGEVDTVGCGIGNDKVVADAGDSVAPDCEVVERGTGPGPGGELTVKAARTSLRKLARSGLAVSVACPAACTLRAKLAVPKASARKLRLKGRTLATARKSLAAAGTAKLRAKPARKLAKRIRRQKKLAITVTVTAKAPDGTRQTGTTRVTVTR